MPAASGCRELWRGGTSPQGSSPSRDEQVRPLGDTFLKGPELELLGSTQRVTFVFSPNLASRLPAPCTVRPALAEMGPAMPTWLV